MVSIFKFNLHSLQKLVEINLVDTLLSLDKNPALELSGPDVESVELVSAKLEGLLQLCDFLVFGEDGWMLWVEGGVLDCLDLDFCFFEAELDICKLFGQLGDFESRET